MRLGNTIEGFDGQELAGAGDVQWCRVVGYGDFEIVQPDDFISGRDIRHDAELNGLGRAVKDASGIRQPALRFRNALTRFGSKKRSFVRVHHKFIKQNPLTAVHLDFECERVGVVSRAFKGPEVYSLRVQRKGGRP